MENCLWGRPQFSDGTAKKKVSNNIKHTASQTIKKNPFAH